MCLGPTQPLTEMSTRDLPGGNGRSAHKADNLTAICELIVQKMSEPQHLTTLWASTACYRASFTFFTFTDRGNRDSSDGSNLLWAEQLRGWSSSPGRIRNSLLNVIRSALGPTQPSIQWVLGAPSLGVKRPGCEDDHSN
jgi:hypothetical protein